MIIHIESPSRVDKKCVVILGELKLGSIVFLYNFFVYGDFQILLMLQICNTFSFQFKIPGSAWEWDSVKNVYSLFRIL
jgi:hypothetical protein